MKNIGSFKPFQGLFCISTSYDRIHRRTQVSVSNPSRDYSAFLPRRAKALSLRIGISFKPFQGLFCISTER